MITRAMKFGAFSLTSFGTNLGLTFVFAELIQLPAEISFLLSLVLMLFFNFACCRWIIFPSTCEPVLPQFTSFLASTAMFRAAEYAGFVLLFRLLGVYYLAAVTIVLMVGFLAKFLFYSRFVFGGSTDTKLPAIANHSFAAGSDSAAASDSGSAAVGS